MSKKKKKFRGLVQETKQEMASAAEIEEVTPSEEVAEGEDIEEVSAADSCDSTANQNEAIETSDSDNASEVGNMADAEISSDATSDSYADESTDDAVGAEVSLDADEVSDTADAEVSGDAVDDSYAYESTDEAVDTEVSADEAGDDVCESESHLEYVDDNANDDNANDLDSEASQEDAPESDSEPPLSPKDQKKKDKQDKKSAKKAKKAKKKSTKIAIIVVTIVLAIAIIATSITVPIVIANKDKIFVKSYEDFKNTDGKYFVLKDDVHITAAELQASGGKFVLGDINNIDFNGKTLTVDGDLVIESTSKNAVILGDVIKNKNDKKKGGTLNAENVTINTAGEMQLSASIVASAFDFKANEIVVSSSINVKNDSVVSATNVSIFAPIALSPKKDEVSTLSVSDVTAFNINSNVSGNISFVNTREMTEGYLTSATITGNISGDVLADKATEMSINSKVGGVIDTNDKSVDEATGNLIANSKIGKVKLMDKSFVKTVFNISLLYVHEDAVFPDHDSSVLLVKMIRPLERVGFININDDTDNIFLSFAKVSGADAYVVKIDNNDPIEITSTTLDITEYVRDVKKHIISVQAISKANAELLLPSEPLVQEYMTYVTLDKASNIKLEKNAENGKITLSFDAVSFADEYIININGNEMKSDKNSIDVTSMIDHGGSFIVSIVATSKNQNIIPSKPSLYQWDNVVSLDKVKLSIKTDEIAKTSTISWEQISSASYYEVVLVEGESEIVLYRTSANELTFGEKNDLGIKAGNTIKVRAISSSPYYTMSDSNSITVE